MRRSTVFSMLALLLVSLTGCVSEAGKEELAVISVDFPALDDLLIDSAERIEVSRFEGSDTPGYEEAPDHDQRYTPNAGNSFDDVKAEIVTALVMEGFMEINDSCYQATTEAGDMYTARVYQFDKNVTTPDVAHVWLGLSTGKGCNPGSGP